MIPKHVRRLRVLATTLVLGCASVATATAALPVYCDPLHGCGAKHYLKASPSTVRAGSRTTVRGTTGGCRSVIIFSRAFSGATSRRFAGVPAFFVTATKKGSFSQRVRISKSIRAGNYHMGGRCGGGNFGSATLRVKH